MKMQTPNFCRVDWKTGGIVIGVLSLIASFPVSASGDVSVSLHLLIVSGCLLYGILKDKSEFLLPYLVELAIVLVQCLISIVNFIVLKPIEDHNFENEIVSDFIYDSPKQFTQDERRFILGALTFTSVVVIFFWIIILALYRRMRYAPNIETGIETGFEPKTCPL